jgi:Reverse transcriptase (RNA-dependent DNA polymerase)
MDDCIDSLGDAKYFSTLGANAGYWQISVTAEDQYKTAFTCHRGSYRFKRLHFGLVTAPATFQRAVDVLLATVWFQCAITYLDDIIVYSSNLVHHLEDLIKVLTLLQRAGISFKFIKCSFCATEVQYLGFIVGRWIEVGSRTEINPPKSKTPMRRFLGLTAVYRRFIEKYAIIAAPLTKYLRSEQHEEFMLDEEALRAQKKLKDLTTSDPVLALPQPGAKTI